MIPALAPKGNNCDKIQEIFLKELTLFNKVSVDDEKEQDE